MVEGSLGVVRRYLWDCMHSKIMYYEYVFNMCFGVKLNERAQPGWTKRPFLFWENGREFRHLHIDWTKQFFLQALLTPPDVHPTPSPANRNKTHRSPRSCRAEGILRQ